MKLQTELDTIRRRFDGSVPQRVLALLDRALTELQVAGLGNDAPGPGDAAPDFELLNQRGESVRLSDTPAGQPVILVFVRGEWCPYCTATIRAWQRMAPLVAERGARLLMVSPLSRAEVADTARRQRLSFDLLCDPWARVAERFGIAYEIAGDYREFVQGEFGLDVGRHNGTLSWRVPVSATFVLDPSRRVVLAHVNPDHRIRLEPDEALAALARLRLLSCH